MIERISLNALKFFYFVAKYGSVTVAAKKLFVTQSAVSKQIYNLEEMLGIALFDRRNKALHLTLEGQRLFDCCQSIFSELDHCLIELSTHKIQSRQLALSCEPTISMKWLIPRLSRFKQLGHDFDVVLLTAGGVVDFENQNIDLAIRRNDFDWGEHLVSEKIADEYITMVQSTHKPETMDVLISSSRPNFFKNLNKRKELKSSLKRYSKVELEHFYLCIEGCVAGLGATIISAYMIEKEIESYLLESLVPAFKDGSAYYLLSQSALEEDSRKLIFLDWLKSEMMLTEQKIKR